MSAPPTTQLQTCNSNKGREENGRVTKRQHMWAKESQKTRGTRGSGEGQFQWQHWNTEEFSEDLHFDSSLHCTKHLANLFKEKQMTPEVKEHGGGALFKTFCVSLNCSLSSLFEGRFLYKNILNQSLSALIFFKDHPCSLSAEWKLQNFSDPPLSGLNSQGKWQGGVKVKVRSQSTELLHDSEWH